ncbi:error-prone DNA polymerase, partial [Vibrio parahaemolyticus]|nr:error-prone DNA polymerase [Vibrio parahaemolyticus]
YWGRWLNQHHANRLWVAIQRHLRNNDTEYIAHCEQLAHEFQLPITACGGVLMHDVERLPLQHVLTAIKHGCSVDKLGFDRISNTERALRPFKKLIRIYKPEWLEEST